MCWRSKTAKHEQYRKFLESIDDSFLTCVVEDLIRNGVLLNPVWSLPTLPTLWFCKPWFYCTSSKMEKKKKKVTLYAHFISRSLQLSERNFTWTRTAFMTIPINLVYHIHEISLIFFTEFSCALPTFFLHPFSCTVWLLTQQTVWQKTFCSVFTGHLLPLHCGPQWDFLRVND